MNKKILIFSGIFIIVILGAIILKNKQASAPDQAGQTVQENALGNQSPMNTETSPSIDSTPSIKNEEQEIPPQTAPIPSPAPQPTTPPPSPAPTPAPATSQSPAPVSASIQNFKFNPNEIIVKKGTTVTWTNSDSAPHTVTIDQGSGPASGLLSQGDSYNYTFDTVGAFEYHCEPHPFMHGTVIVTE